MNEIGANRRNLDWTAQDVAQWLGVPLDGLGSMAISGMADIPVAEPTDLVFADDAAHCELAAERGCGAILTTPQSWAAAQKRPPAGILVSNVRASWVDLLERLEADAPFPAGIHPAAVIDPEAQLADDVSIGAFVTVAAGAVLHDGVRVDDGARVGAGCTIGAGTRIFANAVLYPNVRVGRRCRLHACCVIGADGFGYIAGPRGARKIPHVGGVVIGDDVEIGAAACIDRGRTGNTTIGSGCKLDNLVHVAHNVQIGDGTLIAALVGIAGSVRVGRGVVFGGQSGVADQLEIGDGARIAGRGAVVTNVPGGETWSGYPAGRHSNRIREAVALTYLPDLLKRVRRLERILFPGDDGTHRGDAP
ncbi:MAG: UDP-3-O-(3-hydroxymyristoyl)glucosamine N-acyltransferase [Armatimonadetes bacterium]|nr:UDP-3-O-(3-hydroxymyristoyl)glucosamine N-acyltransferase [Armatimonadota bacterium]MDE2207280.1 UDP-3-O-(3-hydroxymyristoyl)glucosamine N-acyltransferase [Armatimonadota bacterium]